jgi:hypothetical protein
MTEQETVELTLDGIVRLIQEELARVAQALDAGDVEATLDACISALGLALQLSPDATEQVLRVILDAGRTLVASGQSEALSTLGPALVTLADQVRASGVLPVTAAMDAWTTVVSGLGALIGQIGLALAIPASHRAGMWAAASAHAAILDYTTNGLLTLTPWLDTLSNVQSPTSNP